MSNRRSGFDIEFQIVIECNDKKLISSIYKALMPDIKERIEGVCREIELRDLKLIVRVVGSRDRIGRFKGAYLSILRSVSIISQCTNSIK